MTVYLAVQYKENQHIGLKILVFPNNLYVPYRHSVMIKVHHHVLVEAFRRNGMKYLVDQDVGNQIEKSAHVPQTVSFDICPKNVIIYFHRLF